MHHLVAQIILLALVQVPCRSMVEMSSQERYQKFLSLIDSSIPEKDSISFYELGLNSDDPLIYLHCLDWAVATRKVESLVTLEQRFADPSVVDEVRRQTRIAIIKLRFFYTKPELKRDFLREMLKTENPDRLPELFEWLMDMICEWGNTEDSALLTKLEHIPSLMQTLKFTRERLSIDRSKRNTLEAYIRLYRSDSRKTRIWALRKLSRLDHAKVGEFLTHLYQEANLSYSRMEFHDIQTAYLNHKRSFPKYYQR